MSRKLALARLVARGFVLATELQDIGELVPPVVCLRSSAERARYGRLFLDYGPRGSDDGWLHAASEVEQRVRSDAQLAQLDAGFQKLYGPRVQELHRRLTGVGGLASDVAGFFAGLSPGETEALFEDDEGARLAAEAVYVVGLALILMGAAIEGEVRERVLVLAFRARMHSRQPTAGVGGSDGAGDDDGWGGRAADTYVLCMRTDLPPSSPTKARATAAAEAISEDWTALFARVAMPAAVCARVVKRLLEGSDVFCHSGIQGRASKSLAAATLYVILFFVPAALHSDQPLMKHVVAHCLGGDTFAIPFFLGHVVDLTVSWAPFEAARRCLGKPAAIDLRIKQQAERIKAQLPALQGRLEHFLAASTGGGGGGGDEKGAPPLPSMEALDAVAQCHDILRWAVVHGSAGGPQRQWLVLLALPVRSVLRLLVRCCELEWHLDPLVDLRALDLSYALNALRQPSYIAELQNLAADPATAFGVRALLAKLARSLRHGSRLERIVLARSAGSGDGGDGGDGGVGGGARAEKAAGIYTASLFALMKAIDHPLALCMAGVLRGLEPLPGVEAAIEKAVLGEIQLGLLDLSVTATENSGGPPTRAPQGQHHHAPPRPWTSLHECSRWNLPGVCRLLLFAGAEEALELDLLRRSSSSSSSGSSSSSSDDEDSSDAAAAGAKAASTPKEWAAREGHTAVVRVWAEWESWRKSLWGDGATQSGSSKVLAAIRHGGPAWEPYREAAIWSTVGQLGSPALLRAILLVDDSIPILAARSRRWAVSVAGSGGWSGGGASLLHHLCYSVRLQQSQAAAQAQAAAAARSENVRASRASFARSRRECEAATSTASGAGGEGWRQQAQQVDAESHRQIAQMLLECGCDASLMEADTGNTALHYAPSQPVATTLLALAPATMFQENITGQVPRHISAAAARATEATEVSAGLIAWCDGSLEDWWVTLPGQTSCGPQAVVGRLVEIEGHGRGLVIGYTKPAERKLMKSRRGPSCGVHTVQLQSRKVVQVKLGIEHNPPEAVPGESGRGSFRGTRPGDSLARQSQANAVVEWRVLRVNEGLALAARVEKVSQLPQLRGVRAEVESSDLRRVAMAAAAEGVAAPHKASTAAAVVGVDEGSGQDEDGAEGQAEQDAQQQTDEQLRRKRRQQRQKEKQQEQQKQDGDEEEKEEEEEEDEDEEAAAMHRQQEAQQQQQEQEQEQERRQQKQQQKEAARLQAKQRKQAERKAAKKAERALRKSMQQQQEEEHVTAALQEAPELDRDGGGTETTLVLAGDTPVAPNSAVAAAASSSSNVSTGTMQLPALDFDDDADDLWASAPPSPTAAAAETEAPPANADGNDSATPKKRKKKKKTEAKQAQSPEQQQQNVGRLRLLLVDHYSSQEHAGKLTSVQVSEAIQVIQETDSLDDLMFLCEDEGVAVASVVRMKQELKAEMAVIATPEKPDGGSSGNGGGDGSGSTSMSATQLRRKLEDEISAAMDAELFGDVETSPAPQPNGGGGGGGADTSGANGQQAQRKFVRQAELELFGADAETAQASKGEQLPGAWQQLVDSTSGRSYYFNTESQVTQWDPPQEPLSLSPQEPEPEPEKVPVSPTRKAGNSVRWADDVPSSGGAGSPSSASLLVEEQTIAAVGKGRPTPPAYRASGGSSDDSQQASPSSSPASNSTEKPWAEEEMPELRVEAAKKLAKSLAQCTHTAGVEGGMVKIKELPKAERRALERAGLRVELQLFTMHGMPALEAADGPAFKSYKRTVKRVAGRLTSTSTPDEEAGDLTMAREEFVKAAMDKRCRSETLGEKLNALLETSTPRTNGSSS